MLGLIESKIAILIATFLVFSGGMLNGNDKEYKEEMEEINTKQEEKVQDLARYDYLTDEQNPIATITMEDGKQIVLELYPKIAPTTVENFIELANSGFYDGLTFHRTDPNFVIQGGDKEGTGFGKIEYTIEGEFAANGIKNSLKHTEGIISMARRHNDFNSAYTQFFITTVDVHESLDGGYAAFGKVIEGMDVVKEISNVEVQIDYFGNKTETPVNPPVISNITVDTKEVLYQSPKKIVQ